MLKTMSGVVLRYHRWIGLLAALPVILWGLSGLSHPVMTRLQPQPVVMTPPQGMLNGFSLEQLAGVRPLAQLLQTSAMKKISRARLLNWQGEALWQITLPGQAERRYIRASDGALLPGLDEKIAVVLARHYAGEPTRVIRSVQLVTQFSSDYPYINRLLPVWRVEFTQGNHLRAFVETSPLRLATLDNDGKALFGKIFRSLHSWAFIKNETLRDGLMTLFLAAAFLCSAGGLWMYGFYWRKPESGERTASSRRWHRRLGLAAAVTTFTFTGSAILHLQWLDKGSNEQAPSAVDQSLPVEDLMLAPADLPVQENEQIEILPVADQAMIRLSAPSSFMVGKKGHAAMPAVAESPHEHHGHTADGQVAALKKPADARYFSARDGHGLVAGEEWQAKNLAATFAGVALDKITGAEQIRKFDGEYGFVNKRLPVWKVSVGTVDHLALYVETGTGIKAAEVNDRQRLEGLSFAYLHKWIFLDVIGKNGRDFLLGLFALLNAVVACLGLVLWWRRLRRA